MWMFWPHGLWLSAVSGKKRPSSSLLWRCIITSAPSCIDATILALTHWVPLHKQTPILTVSGSASYYFPLHCPSSAHACRWVWYENERGLSSRDPRIRRRLHSVLFDVSFSRQTKMAAIRYSNGIIFPVYAHGKAKKGSWPTAPNILTICNHRRNVCAAAVSHLVTLLGRRWSLIRFPVPWATDTWTV